MSSKCIKREDDNAAKILRDDKKVEKPNFLWVLQQNYMHM
jgi:hypothetical protein